MTPPSDAKAFVRALAPVRGKRWVAYAKPPFAGPKAVLAHLSRYTHRVAISSRRILAFDGENVSFRVKDYRPTEAGQARVMTLVFFNAVAQLCRAPLNAGDRTIRKHSGTQAAVLTRLPSLAGDDGLSKSP